MSFLKQKPSQMSLPCKFEVLLLLSFVITLFDKVSSECYMARSKILVGLAEYVEDPILTLDECIRVCNEEPACK